ncbi:MAG: restriction endonuclease subunit S [Deltaproteobacteria bacterium]|nr:restriction endonuclease subunit S [Deltaproteobacteria bacterium]
MGSVSFTLAQRAVRKSATHIVPAGNLIFATRVGVGKVVVTKIDVAISQDGTGIIIDPKEVDPTFLAYQLRTESVQRFVTQNKRGATIQGITRPSLQQVDVVIPPFTEQQRIAYVLSTVQAAIEQQERLIKLTRELKSALMHKLFTEGLQGEKQKMTEIGLVPESWEIKSFEQFTILQRGKDLTKDNFKNGRVPVAGSNGIIGYHDVAFVKAPGVTVGRSGSVGKVTFYDQEFWAHNTSLYVKDFHGNDPRFAAYYLEVLDLGRFKTGASVPTLDRNSFKHLPIAVPSKDEQIEIGNNLSVVDKKIEITYGRKAKLEELFRTLLHQLMTGQTRVNEIDLPGFVNEKRG